MYEWFVLRGIKRPACRFDSSGFCVWEEEPRHLTSAKSRIMGELLEEAQVQSFNSRHVMLLYIFNSHNGVELYWKTCRNQRILCIDPNYRCTVSWSFCCTDTARQFLIRFSRHVPRLYGRAALKRWDIFFKARKDLSAARPWINFLQTYFCHILRLQSSDAARLQWHAFCVATATK